MNNDLYLEYLENKNNNIDVTDYERTNANEILEPVGESFTFKDNKSLEIINNKMYLSPLLFLSPTDNPFKQEKREYPIDFGFPQSDRLVINIDIPDGYKIETIPQQVNTTTGEDVAFFKYIVSATDSQLSIVVTSSNNKSIVSADYYNVLKEFYKNMIEKQNEKIVFVKK